MHKSMYFLQAVLCITPIKIYVIIEYYDTTLLTIISYLTY
jgi:hypothetical protein